MEELKQLLRKNLEYSRETFEVSKKLQRYMITMQVFSVIKTVVVVIPIVLALVYAVPFLRESFSVYRDVLSNFQQLGSTTPEQFLLEALKK